MRRMLLCGLAALTLGGSLTGCFYRERGPDYDYRDREGRVYRHARWHDEDVWRREDGRWYTRRNNDWILRAEVNIE